MEKQRLGFTCHIPEKIIFFAITACMVLCLTGTASAINQIPINIETGQSGTFDSIDPGFILRSPAIDIDPEFILPSHENDVDPDFSISEGSDEITVVPFSDESEVTPDAYSVQIPDRVVIIPQP